MIKISERDMPYPLAKTNEQQAYRGYDNYQGELVWMSPDQFLRFAGSGSFEGNEDKLIALREKMSAGIPLDFLVLELNADSYLRKDIKKEPIKVIGHEGRNRAIVAKELGISKVPVLLYPLSYRKPNWSEEFKNELMKMHFIPQTF